MEPLKKVQVEGFLMYAEPEVLFGNLDELCSVSTISFCRLQIIHSNSPYVIELYRCGIPFQVTHSFCKEFLRIMLYHITPEGDIHVADAMKRLFFHSAALQLNENENVSINSSHVLQPSTKAKLMSEAYHRYALNYINALNYLETLRRHQDFCDFEKVIFHLLFELDC